MDDIIKAERGLAAGGFSDWLSDRFSHLELDIGCNKGHFLRRIAKYHGSRRYIGVDINHSLCDLAAIAIRREGLTNARVVNIEAHRFIRKYIQTNSINAIHIYFPTPYPRSIGLSRRLINRDFLEEVYRCLLSGGSLRIVTDHEQYFTEINDCLRYLPWWHIDWVPPLPLNRSAESVIDTPSEDRYSSKSEAFSLQVLK